MCRYLLVSCLFLFASGWTTGQEISHQYTKAAPPPAEALERLNLKLAWFRKVPMTGLKDSIASVQLLPGEEGDEILIQTASGLVQLRDAENGDLKWQTPVGMPFRFFHGAAFNSHTIYVTREARLYALNRATGKHRLYSIQKGTGAAVLGFPLLNAPSTTMIADEVALFIPSGNRLTGYVMPKVSELQVDLDAPKPDQPVLYKNLPSSPQPHFQGTFVMIEATVAHPPVMYLEAIGLYTNDGALVSVNKFKLTERFHFKTYGISLAGIGQHRDMVYVGSSDYNVYAINLISSKLRWRFLSGSAIVETPQATDADVFAVSEKLGLCRLNREDGKLLWKNVKARLFLATNGKFVYARDAQRNLLVLDYLKGTTLSKYDLSDFLVPYSNTMTDRIYLANHDGAVMCLHHQSFKKPYRPATPEE